MSSFLVPFSYYLVLNILLVDVIMGISFTAKAEGGEWSGSLNISNIQLDGKPLTVNNWLVVSFNVPTKNFSGIAFWYPFGTSITPYINKKTDSSTIHVKAYLRFSSLWTFDPANTLTFGVTGDMSLHEEIAKSVGLTNDPSGTVNIQLVNVPKEFVGIGQILNFTDEALVVQTAVKTDSPSPFQIVSGTFIVAASELTNGDQTLVATSQGSPSPISVENGKTTSLTVTYSDVKHYSAIDVTIGIISPLQNEQFHVTVKIPGEEPRDFWRSANSKFTVYRLPQSGIFDIGIGTITFNNVQFSFQTQRVDASVKPHQAVTFQQVAEEPVTPPDSVKLPIIVETEVAPDAIFSVRITLLPENYIYTQQVKAKVGTTDFAVLVAPGNYTVQVSGFIHNSIVYVPEAPPSTLSVGKDGKAKLTLHFNAGPNLKVPGFPDFLSFGGCTDLKIDDYKSFKDARASSVFKYAGLGGNGDPDIDLADDVATVHAIEFADKVGKELKKQVLPVMISYTCDLSGGNMNNLKDVKKLAHSFGNLILSLTEANKTFKGLKDPSVVAIGYIVNPDFLGECQKRFGPNYEMEVSVALKAALETRGMTSLEIPTSIKDTLSGYVLAVNWLLKAIPAKLKFEFIVTFGWQINLWGSGSAVWIFDHPPDPKNDPATVAQTTVNYINSLSLFNGPYRPDFLAVDRYERDDFVPDAGVYRFGPHEWPRFFDFCKAISMSLKVPVTPWQIPSSRTPLVKDSVTNLETEHWGTGGSYILGDEGLSSNYYNANSNILALQFNNEYVPYKTVKDLFAKQPFDWSKPAYHDFPLRGIFAVLLGGGQTTGIVTDTVKKLEGAFARDKLHAYMDHPIPTDNLNT